MSDFISTTVKVPVGTLQEYARKLREYADVNGDVFDRICNSMDALQMDGQWVGASQKAAALATEQNMSTFEQTVNELGKLADYLQKFADEMARKDEEIKRQINRAARHHDEPDRNATKVAGRITYLVK